MTTAEDITVELRLAKPDSNVRAFADVTLSLGENGSVSMFGFSVLGDPPRVVPPARKGDKRFFDIVLLNGKVKTLVYTKIGMSYKAALVDATKEMK
ncbi:MAG: hypothetical protein ABSA39_04410 [Edaphobacter sp.]